MENNCPYTPEELAAIKPRLADAFLKYPFDIPGAMRSVEPRVTHHPFLASLQYDPELNQLMRERNNQEGAKSTLPTKEEFAATIWNDAAKARTSDVKLDFYKLFASVMGYVEKPGNPSGNTTNIATQNVLVMPAKQAGGDFEDKWIGYGAKLINE